jgi:hypothetical protein
MRFFQHRSETIKKEVSVPPLVQLEGFRYRSGILLAFEKLKNLYVPFTDRPTHKQLMKGGWV